MERDYSFLFNSSLYHRISFLEPMAARALITEPAKGSYDVAPDAVATKVDPRIIAPCPVVT